MPARARLRQALVMRQPCGDAAASKRASDLDIVASLEGIAPQPANR
jgi:hypothetical protein